MTTMNEFIQKHKTDNVVLNNWLKDAKYAYVFPYTITEHHIYMAAFSLLEIDDRRPILKYHAYQLYRTGFTTSVLYTKIPSLTKESEDIYNEFIRWCDYTPILIHGSTSWLANEYVNYKIGLYNPDETLEDVENSMKQAVHFEDDQPVMLTEQQFTQKKVELQRYKNYRKSLGEMVKKNLVAEDVLFKFIEEQSNIQSEVDNHIFLSRTRYNERFRQFLKVRKDVINMRYDAFINKFKVRFPYTHTHIDVPLN